MSRKQTCVFMLILHLEFEDANIKDAFLFN